ncbi:MAG: hypothetical protein U1E13_12075, partial [Methylophilaceae bacterium]|nr:hypothetical protein [Methylophilaceae bacterium]
MNQRPQSNLLWHFVRANLAYMLSGKLRSKKGYQPPAGHHIPADFAGIGVATAADARMDDAVIHHLNSLGIRQVRLDFTYGDDQNHVVRFLEKLIELNFKVMLHLVQPFDAA